MKIFAHRGLLFEYPENTLPSFRESLKRGFGLELDVHRTYDGGVVVIHDANTEHATGVDAKVAESDLSYLKTLDFGAKALDGKFANQGITIPTLKEVSDLFHQEAHPETEIAIQIKDCQEEDIERLIVGVLDNFDRDYQDFQIYNRVFVFDPVISSAEKFRALQPKIRLSLSIGEASRFPDSSYPTIYRYDSVKDSGFEIVWADEWVGGLYSREFIEKCHSQGKKVYAISPELHKHTDPKHPLSEEGYETAWKNLISWGVDGICTDFPDKLEEIYKEMTNEGAGNEKKNQPL